VPNIIKQKNPPSKKHIARKKMLIIIVAAIIVAGSIGAWLYVQGQKHTDTTPTVTRTTDQIQQIVSDADAKANSGDISGAKTAYDNAIKQTSDAAQKSYLLIGDASLYYDEGNYDQALVLAKQAESYKLDENVASMMAEMYKMKGDKQNAIIYYQKSISLIDKTNSVDDNTLYYQNEINALNGVGN
jgi:tetratricopeptide (TPR) repeat protein